MTARFNPPETASCEPDNCVCLLFIVLTWRYSREKSRQNRITWLYDEPRLYTANIIKAALLTLNKRFPYTLQVQRNFQKCHSRRISGSRPDVFYGVILCLIASEVENCSFYRVKSLKTWLDESLNTVLKFLVRKKQLINRWQKVVNNDGGHMACLLIVTGINFLLSWQKVSGHVFLNHLSY